MTREKGNGQPTLVRKAYFSGLADDFWILFCFFYGRGYQLFELHDWIVRKRAAKQKKRGLTRDIFTDCESAYDSDNFVLTVDWCVRRKRQRNKPLTYSLTLCVT